MNKIYTIVENGIPIGFFVEEQDRDKAFDICFVHQKRWGIKSLIEV